jgi:hypothetical protein
MPSACDLSQLAPPSKEVGELCTAAIACGSPSPASEARKASGTSKGDRTGARVIGVGLVLSVLPVIQRMALLATSKIRFR